MTIHTCRYVTNLQLRYNKGMKHLYGRTPEISAETKQAWQPQRNDHSSGGVAYRVNDKGELEFALIATQGGMRWQLPKGTCEAGETSEETAIREVEEESGLATTPECLLKVIHYWYWDTYRKESPVLVHKSVDLYLLRIVGGELSDASFEVDAVAWFTPQRALAILAFDGEREVVELAAKQLEQRFYQKL